MTNKIEIGRIENTHSWEYDSWSNVAILFLDLNTMILNISVSQIHFKSGLGKGVFTKHLLDLEVGTLYKPNKGLIRSILAKYKQQYTFAKDGWSLLDNSDKTLKNFKLSDLLEYTINDNLVVSRFIKIKAIKAKING